MPQPEERTWAAVCHLAFLGGYIIPLGWIVIPLFIWLVKRERSSYIDLHGKEAVNFQLTMLSANVIAIVLIFTIILLPFGLLLLGLVALFKIACGAYGALMAYNEEPFHYPVCIRFIA